MAKSQQKQLIEFMDDFDTAMLVTSTEDGELRARPMAIAETTKHDTLLFVTDRGSTKADEIEARPLVNVAMQGDDTYLSVSGRAKVLRDRDSIDKAWSPALRPWFPDGKDSEDIAVLEVEPQRGEYWNMDTKDKLAFMVEAGMAVVQNEPLGDGGYGDHATVSV